MEALHLTHKSKEFARVLSNLNVDTKVLVVVEYSSDFALLAARNVQTLQSLTKQMLLY